jgi:hypothetical protein
MTHHSNCYTGVPQKILSTLFSLFIIASLSLSLSHLLGRQRPIFSSHPATPSFASFPSSLPTLWFLILSPSLSLSCERPPILSPLLTVASLSSSFRRPFSVSLSSGEGFVLPRLVAISHPFVHQPSLTRVLPCPVSPSPCWLRWAAVLSSAHS